MKNYHTSQPRGSAPAELFIVIALLAILALTIAPNWHEAQNRSNTAQARHQLKRAAVALGAYHIDYFAYPYDGYNWNGETTLMPGAQYYFWYLPPELSTPIAYLASSYVRDPFRFLGDGRCAPSISPNPQFCDIRYSNMDSTWGTQFDGILVTGAPNSPSSSYDDVVMECGGWRLSSAGPDSSYGPTGWQGISNYPSNPIPYDPTNGSMSTGDIIRTERSPFGYLNAQ